MEKLRRYLEAFDGSAGWDTVGPLFEDLLHDDLAYVTPNGELSKDQFRPVVQNALATGIKVSDVRMHGHGDEIIHFDSKVTADDGTVTPSSSSGTIKVGKLVRVEPRDPGT